MQVLLAPVVNSEPAFLPNAVLLEPVLKPVKQLVPTPVFSLPSVRPEIAWLPTAVLLPPVVTLCKA